MSVLLQLSVASLLFLLRTTGIVSSQKSVFYFFYQRPVYPRDCKEALDSCHYDRSSGVYVIKPDGYQKPFEVFCDNTVDSGGWTVILRRHDGSVTFQRDWLEYKRGFGFSSQELWLGHEKLSFLTNQKIYELRIDFTYSDGTSIYALYRFFRLSDDFSNYKLLSGGLFAGTVDFTKCPTNMKYGSCLCQSSCGNFQDCQPCPQNEACFCPSGFYLRGADCVTQRECGCFIDGDTIGEGQTYTSPGCSKRCSCNNGQLSCDENYRCDPNAACLLQNNMYQCTCNEGYSPVGDTCLSICSTNEVYGTCSCERSCGNPQVCVTCTQGQRCYCPNGFYLQGQDCVPQLDCNCFTDGMIIPEGQTYTALGCLKRCSCNTGQLSCDENYRCDPNAACVLQNNMYQCICNEGYSPDGDTCVSICSTNEIYGTCACETSCEDPLGCLPCTQGQRCYCPNGFYLQGQDCVRQLDCNCFTDGMIIPEGQTYTSPGCSKRCSCNNGQLSCDNNYRCDPNAACLLQNNMYQCICNEGYSPVGDTCLSICSTNEVYGTCSCETSCGNPQVCVTCTQGQRCYCPSGFYLQGQDCVPQNECGCHIDGVIVPEGDTYVDSVCSQQCTCNNNQLNCNNNYECSPNAACRVENNVRKCYCNEGYEGDGETCTATITYPDCYDAYQADQRQDGVYSILPSGWTGSPFDVPCNMTIDGGGWTVLQRRVDGSESFEHNWNEYKNGFGVPGPEFWLGNDKIFYLTNQRDYELRMDMVNLDGNAYYAKYNLFRISDEDSKYQLELGTYDSASTASYDAMDYHRNQFFSTPDRDNGPSSSNHCAANYRAGWWYRYCYYCDFNSYNFEVDPYYCPYWYYLPGNDCLMYTDIKIRPV